MSLLSDPEWAEYLSRADCGLCRCGGHHFGAVAPVVLDLEPGVAVAESRGLVSGIASPVPLGSWIFSAMDEPAGAC